jgi:hypothetical protein
MFVSNVNAFQRRLLCKLSLSFVNIPSTELLARRCNENATPDKVLKLQPALQVNELRTPDPVCLYGNCLHPYLQYVT